MALPSACVYPKQSLFVSCSIWFCNSLLNLNLSWLGFIYEILDASSSIGGLAFTIEAFSMETCHSQYLGEL